MSDDYERHPCLRGLSCTYGKYDPCSLDERDCRSKDRVCCPVCRGWAKYADECWGCSMVVGMPDDDRAFIWRNLALANVH